MKRCFIISPIGEPNSEIRDHADTVYLGIIVPALDELRKEGIDIEPIRSDQLQEPGNISQQMFRELFQDDLCIVILTFSNPNVFYELAVAQCAYRPVVVLLKEGEKLPFDVVDLRTVPYDLDNKLRLIRKQDAQVLAAHIRTMLSDTWTPSHPFGSDAPAAWVAVRQPQTLQTLIETARPKPLSPGVDSVFRLPKNPSQQIIIRTGDIRHVKDIDVLVTSENTDLQLARYYDPSVSGTLRYLDAERGIDGRVVYDSLDASLKSLIKEQNVTLPVMSGTVIAMPTSGLSRRGIRYLLLAATVRGDGVGTGYSPVGHAEIENCIRDCFRQFDELAQQGQIHSILFPVFGAGTAKQDPEQAVEFLLPIIVEAMGQTPSCKQANVLAWVESHRSALGRVALQLGLEREEQPNIS
jgi:hypothetical protein